VSCFLFLLLSPTLIHGEILLKEESEGLLVGTLKNVGEELKSTTTSIDRAIEGVVHGARDTVKDTVVFTEQTVKSMSESAKNGTEPSLLKNTRTLLENTVDNTLPVVEITTEVITETIRTTSTEITNTVDSIVNVLPEIPVVEVVKEISEHTTTEVLKTVNQTVDSVVAELPTLPVVSPIVKQVGNTVTETVSAVLSNQVKPVADEIEKIPGSIPKDRVTETVKTESNELRNDSKTMNMENDKPYHGQKNALQVIPEEESAELVNWQEPVLEERTGLNDRLDQLPDEVENLRALPISKATSNPVSMKIVAPKQTGYTGGDFVNSQKEVLKKEVHQKPHLPSEPRQNWGNISAATITSSMSSLAFSPLQISGHNDLSFGVVVDVYSLIISNGGQWLPSNEYAMIQWTHAPPGQPPQRTPFLNVKQTL